MSTEKKLQKIIKLVLKGDQGLWWMDGRWHYYSKYWTNKQQENGFRGTFVSVFLQLCPCWCSTVERVVFVLFQNLLHKNLNKWARRHSHAPLLDQKDGYQHQQYEDENTSTDPSDLHHPVCLFSRVRNDFWLLCSTYNIITWAKSVQMSRKEH